MKKEGPLHGRHSAENRGSLQFCVVAIFPARQAWRKLIDILVAGTAAGAAAAVVAVHVVAGMKILHSPHESMPTL